MGRRADQGCKAHCVQNGTARLGVGKWSNDSSCAWMARPRNAAGCSRAAVDRRRSSSGGTRWTCSWQFARATNERSSVWSFDQASRVRARKSEGHRRSFVRRKCDGGRGRGSRTRRAGRLGGGTGQSSRRHRPVQASTATLQTSGSIVSTETGALGGRQSQAPARRPNRSQGECARADRARSTGQRSSIRERRADRRAMEDGSPLRTRWKRASPHLARSGIHLGGARVSSLLRIAGLRSLSSVGSAEDQRKSHGRRCALFPETACSDEFRDVLEERLLDSLVGTRMANGV